MWESSTLQYNPIDHLGFDAVFDCLPGCSGRNITPPPSTQCKYSFLSPNYFPRRRTWRHWALMKNQDRKLQHLWGMTRKEDGTNQREWRTVFFFRLLDKVPHTARKNKAYVTGEILLLAQNLVVDIKFSLESRNKSVSPFYIGDNTIFSGSRVTSSILSPHE